MEIVKEKKKIDYSKTNIGIEIECFIIEIDSFANISRNQSQNVFQTLIKKFGWLPKDITATGEIQKIEKDIVEHKIKIVYDTSYSIFEIVTINPLSSLHVLEKINKTSLSDLRQALKEHGLMIWPFGVAPASTGWLKLPGSTHEEIIDDRFYNTIREMNCISRMAHITSHQVNIDIPFQKMLPAINAFFKNLGPIIEKFANSAAYFNGILYREGRSYWWGDSYPELKNKKFGFYTHEFPPQEHSTWDDFLQWIFNHNLLIFRNNDTYVPVKKFFSFHQFLREEKSLFKNKDGDIIETKVTKDDFENFMLQINVEFAPHFDFYSYTIEDFLRYYKNNDLDGFFEKYCKHCWLEIRPCSPHFEENAMVIPHYFYDIVLNLDEYIEKSKKISWDEARIARDKAIGYL